MVVVLLFLKRKLTFNKHLSRIDFGGNLYFNKATQLKLWPEDTYNRARISTRTFDIISSSSWWPRPRCSCTGFSSLLITVECLCTLSAEIIIVISLSSFTTELKRCDICSSAHKAVCQNRPFYISTLSRVGGRVFSVAASFVAADWSRSYKGTDHRSGMRHLGVADSGCCWAKSFLQPVISSNLMERRPRADQ